MSQAFGNLDLSNAANVDVSWRGASHRQRSGSVGVAGTPEPPGKKSSIQAMMIDNARDLVDESDDEGDALEGREDGHVSVDIPIFGVEPSLRSAPFLAASYIQSPCISESTLQTP